MGEEKKHKLNVSKAREFGDRFLGSEHATVREWQQAAKFARKNGESFVARVAKIAKVLGLDDDAELLPRLEALAAEVSIEKVFRGSVTINGNDARVKIRVAERASTKSAKPVATGFSCDLRRVPELIRELQWALGAADEEGDFE